jgi:hypothetical protein
MLTTQTVVVPLVGAAVVNAVVFGALGVMRYRRKKAYQGWAARHQMRYTRRDDAWLTRCAWGWPFGRGSGQHAIDILTGMYRGRQAACFTYRYTTRRQGAERTAARSTGTTSACSRSSCGIPCRSFEWRNRSSATDDNSPRPGSRPHSRFAVRTLPYPRRVLHPEIQRFLLTNDLGGFSVVDDRIFIRTRGRVDPDRIEHYLDVLITVIEHTPDTVGLG